MVMDVVVKDWKGVLEVSSPPSSLQVSMLPRALTSHVLSIFKMALHSLSGEPVPLLAHPCGKSFFS